MLQIDGRRVPDVDGDATGEVDGSHCEEVCVVRENIARLLVSRSLRQVQPKGLPMTQKIHFEVCVCMCLYVVQIFKCMYAPRPAYDAENTF